MDIRKTFKQLVDLRDLRPSEEVNSLFSRLVSHVVKSQIKGNLTRYEVSRLQDICSDAEYELERYWSEQIINANNPEAEIKKFPYYNNYEKLTKLEWCSLEGCTEHKKHSILFLGGGPLPMTAILLAQKYKEKSVIIDNNFEAVRVAKLLVKSINLEKMIEVRLADATTFDGYKNFNTIFLAALAGSSLKEKENIVRAIRKSCDKNVHVLARSSWGSRSLLYKPLPNIVYKIFNPIIKIDPFNDIVNSIVIFQVK